MMTTTETIGEHVPDKARGWLVFTALPDSLQRQEDSTQGADFQRGLARYYGSFTRDATATERELLIHTGVTVPVELATKVSFPAPGVRHRGWPALPETETR